MRLMLALITLTFNNYVLAEQSKDVAAKNRAVLEFKEAKPERGPASLPTDQKLPTVTTPSSLNTAGVYPYTLMGDEKKFNPEADKSTYGTYCLLCRGGTSLRSPTLLEQSAAIKQFTELYEKAQAK